MQNIFLNLMQNGHGCDMRHWQNFFPLHAKKIKTPTCGFKMKIPRFSVDTVSITGRKSRPKSFRTQNYFSSVLILSVNKPFLCSVTAYQSVTFMVIGFQYSKTISVLAWFMIISFDIEFDSKYIIRVRTKMIISKQCLCLCVYLVKLLSQQSYVYTANLLVLGFLSVSQICLNVEDSS